MSEDIFDVVIIGGGPAGLTAGIYTARETLKTLLLEKELTGGLPAKVDMLENYPGFQDGILGMELMDKMRAQAEKFGVNFGEFEDVSKIVDEGKTFRLITENAEYISRAVIISTGGLPRPIGLESERALLGKGVSYCAVCDGPLYKNAELVVVGGGDAAVQEGIYLTKFAKKVTIVHRRDQLRAQPILQQRAFANEKISFKWDSVATEILGNDHVEGVEIRNVKTNEKSRFAVDGVFVFIGWTPNTAFVKDLLKLDGSGHIITDENMETSVKGIFAIGDVRSKKYRQIANAVGDGAIGALAVSDYLAGIL
ncbi:MAG: thioredoxin-disulfide reductase [Candidatus Marinimicrobia bacterium]|nr:thioredoxin-disulfide reductase [Candidatus Neomarinimicrobiota bacterium]